MWVRLSRDWTDPSGVDHVAGDVVEVDAVTRADLEAAGVGGAMEAPEQVTGPFGTVRGPAMPGYAQDDTIIVSDERDRPGGPEPRREWS